LADGKLSELDKSTNQKLFELALGTSDKALERARAAGTFIQGTAAALGTLYTGILTLVFVAKDNPLPARGLIPTLFFALAMALAAFHTAFISQRVGTPIMAAFLGRRVNGSLAWRSALFGALSASWIRAAELARANK
jgi:hypothetical protein